MDRHALSFAPSARLDRGWWHDRFPRSAREPPIRMQKTGVEWVFPPCAGARRLLKRYAKDCWFFGGSLALQWWRTHFRSRRKPALAQPPRPVAGANCLGRAGAARNGSMPQACNAAPKIGNGLWPGDRDLLLHLANCPVYPQTCFGFIIRVAQTAHLENRHLFWSAPARPCNARCTP